MHATPIAAKPPDGDRMAERSHCESPFADVRLCIHGADDLSAEHLESLRRRLPSSARLCVFGTHAAWPGVEHCPIGPEEGRDPLAVLAAAAAAFPQEHLILVRADLDLPPFACERLLRALQADGVLGALPLDERRLDPSRRGVLRTAAEYAIDAVRLDALCYAVAERRLDEDAHFPRNVPALSAWHGARLAGLGTQALRHADAFDAAGLSVVQLDHLYVESGAPPGSDDEDAAPSPLALLRERLAAAIRADLVPALPGLDGRPVLLHVLHGWGGGAERWVRDYAAADTAAHHLVLIARGRFASRRHGEWLELHDGAMQGPPLRRWPLPRPIADTALGDATYRRLFADVVRDFCVDGIVVSSLIGHSLDALRSALPTVAVVHDHYPLWPMLHRNFGDPALAFDAAQLAADLAANGKDAEFADRDPAHWRHLRDATVDALRSANATLVAPSRSALANHLRLAPELAALRAEIVPHGLAAWPAGAPTEAPPPRERLRLLVPGRIRRGKGAELLRAALPRLREHAELFLLGAGSDAHDLFGESGLHVVLDYRRDEFPALLARIRPDAALLLPTVAETFSYMLSELRSLGLPVVATRVGALAERIEDGVDGFLVDTDVEAIAACIERLAREPAAIGAVRANLVGFPHATTAETAQRYTRLLDLLRRASARYPLAMTGADSLLEAALASELARASARERTIRAELLAARSESERRGEWGHGLDRELAATRSRLTRLNEAHDALHDELKQRTDWALALDAELQGVKPHYEQILASSSWRLTAPLRAGKNRLRALRASLAYRTLHLRSLAGRLRGSLAQRGLAGTLKRVAQEFRRSGPAQARLTYAEPTDDFAPFALPTSETPRVSIIVPVYNKIAYTGACLRSIAEQAGPTPFEVIVVDDGSTDATAQRLAGIAGLRLLRNERNLGFIGSCNAGAAAARGDCVLFLNNDTVVTEGWLEALVRCLEEAPDAGLVGAKLVYPDGRLQEAGGIVFDDGSGWNVGRFDEPDDPRYGFRREVDYCSGAAIVLRRELFEQLGRFDTRYTPAYYEDTDLAFAVRAAGLKVWYEPAATVVHFEG
ncbi:glycosyltransferase, partial [Dokdonella sp.]|uniref:glycosyltransferase n=1 Tax=Dokdonella sp. TaxID=2291710 RepID=UPI0031F332A1